MTTSATTTTISDPIIAHLSTLARDLDAKEACEILGISNDTLYRRIADGSIGYRRPSRIYKFSPAHLIKYIEDRTYTPLK
jgi:excisionase family DNA binding protein